jgi:hypothetical protein
VDPGIGLSYLSRITGGVVSCGAGLCEQCEAPSSTRCVTVVFGAICHITYHLERGVDQLPALTLERAYRIYFSYMLGKPSSLQSLSSASRLCVQPVKGGCWDYDAGKGISGRKRHLLADTLGLVLVAQGIGQQAGPSVSRVVAGRSRTVLPYLPAGVGRWRT